MKRPFVGVGLAGVVVIHGSSGCDERLWMNDAGAVTSAVLVAKGFGDGDMTMYQLQERDQLQDRTQLYTQSRLRLRDGSCQDDPACDGQRHGWSNEKGNGDRVRLRDPGTCGG